MQNRQQQGVVTLLFCLSLVMARHAAAMPAGQPENPGAEAAVTAAERAEDAPVDLFADEVSHDDRKQIVTAEGHVEIVQGKRILRSEKVNYDLARGIVTAEGNVVFTDENGDVHFAEKMELANEMADGFVEEIRSYLAAGGILTAARGKRQDANLITLYDAAYTPCDCEGSDAGEPTWQIKADEVVYNEAEHNISYKNAQLELFGLPVFYTPRLSHPDSSVKRKSGFLTPTLGFNSDLGAHVSESYYIDIAPDKDATIGTLLSTDVSPVALAEYRQHFDKAAIILSGSVTHSDRTDDVNGQEVEVEDEMRGHLFAAGQLDINSKWRAGTSLELSSDDQYLRQYDFSEKDVLENQIYAERFSGRDYAVGRLLAFQDVRVRELQTDQPNVLPQIQVNMLGDPNEILGGRWSADMSALGLQRSDGQDVTRYLAEVGWKRRMVADVGLVNTAEISARGDFYYTADRDYASTGSGRSNESTATRAFPQAQWTTSYPLAKPLETAQIVMEPIASLTLATDVDNGAGDIPNEDSQDVQIDAINIFNTNRFPGYDRIEDRSRVTYGMKTGVYGMEGGFASAFLGQSYRLEEGDNPFPQGSGLSDRSSDYVGQISAYDPDLLGLDYRFQLSSETLSSQRHEIESYTDLGRLHLDVRYLYATGLAGTQLDTSREQARGGAAFDLTENWRVKGDILYDFGEFEGMRETTFGFEYLGCCLTLSGLVRRSNTYESSGETGTEIMLRLGLKGLGEFATDYADVWQASNR